MYGVCVCFDYGNGFYFVENGFDVSVGIVVVVYEVSCWFSLVCVFVEMC